MNERQKLLIADDKAENLYVLEQTLRKTGAQIVQCSSGNEALVASLEHNFALAVLDVRMPGMDGYELAELLRGDSKTLHLPIIFLTAEFGEEEQIFKGYEAGAIDYIVKPYNSAILLAKVKLFLKLDQQRQELREQSALLEATNRELEEFAHSVSHDLRTPLHGIDGFSKALLEDCSDQLDETGKDYLRRVRGGVERMESLIENLLRLSRLNRTEMHLQRLDLGELARKCLGDLREAEPERSVEFVVKPQSLEAYGDRALLEIAVNNLLSNAWKFTSRHTAARIEVGTTQHKGRPVYFVRDDGAGFDMAFAKKLFGPFQRLHDTKSFPGIGIGLAIVMRIIARHGGQLWAESEVEKGATFFFTLPNTVSAS